jgi:hypothetical protein
MNTILGLGAALLVYLAVGAFIAVLTRSFSVSGWLLQLFLVVDQALNVLLTPFHAGAWADETMSARAWRADRDGRRWGRVTRPVIDWLFAWQRAEGGHCRRAYERERERMHSPPETRAVPTETTTTG